MKRIVVTFTCDRCDVAAGTRDPATPAGWLTDAAGKRHLCVGCADILLDPSWDVAEDLRRDQIEQAIA